MTTRSVALTARAKPRTSGLRRKEIIAGYLFLLPWIIGFFAFTAGPMIASAILSLTTYDMVNVGKFVGLNNYSFIMFKDELVWPSLLRTFQYAIIMVPASLIGSLLAALLLNQGLKGTPVYRTLYFLPHLTPIVAAVMLWGWFFDPDIGPLDMMLRSMGVQNPPGWFRAPDWAMWALIIMAMWGAMGGNNMLIFLAGLQGVPQEMYEAAAIDGAGTWAKFRNVTLPLLSPTIFFNLVLGVIGALRVFDSAFIATGGGPAYATYFYALHIYNKAFRYFEMGYASALSWIFFFITLAFTLVQFRSSSRWVFYQGEVRQ
jgi:multiple sugar transport system permease protein